MAEKILPNTGMVNPNMATFPILEQLSDWGEEMMKNKEEENRE